PRGCWSSPHVVSREIEPIAGTGVHHRRRKVGILFSLYVERSKGCSQSRPAKLIYCVHVEHLHPKCHTASGGTALPRCSATWEHWGFSSSRFSIALPCQHLEAPTS